MRDKGMRGKGRLAVPAATFSLLITGVFAAYAIGDDLVASPDAVNPAVGASVPVNVTLVAADDPDWNGDDQVDKRCNLRGEGHYVNASVTSSNPAVATVDPALLQFTDCGQTLPITITAVSCGSAEITITEAASNNAGGVNAVFSEDKIVVTVNSNCDTGPPITACARPAAPAWAAAILKANAVKPKAADNLISMVAGHMTQGAAFDGYAKSESPEYEDAVYAFLLANKPGNVSLPKGPADVKVVKPSWACTTATV